MDWNSFKQNLSIVVVSNKHRDCLSCSYLKEESFKLSLTPDYEFNSKEFVLPQYAGLLYNKVGHLRCFKGHQDAIKLADTNSDYILVLEDDAQFLDGWQSCVMAAATLLDDYEVVSLHGRDFKPENMITSLGIEFSVKNKDPYKDDLTWVLGSLAYLIKRSLVPRITSFKFNGIPMDLLIATRFTFAVINNSPFIHSDCKSVLATAKENQ